MQYLSVSMVWAVGIIAALITAMILLILKKSRGYELTVKSGCLWFGCVGAMISLMCTINTAAMVSITASRVDNSGYDTVGNTCELYQYLDIKDIEVGDSVIFEDLLDGRRKWFTVANKEREDASPRYLGRWELELEREDGTTMPVLADSSDKIRSNVNIPTATLIQFNTFNGLATTAFILLVSFLLFTFLTFICNYVEEE